LTDDQRFALAHVARSGQAQLLDQISTQVWEEFCRGLEYRFKWRQNSGEFTGIFDVMANVAVKGVAIEKLALQPMM
jgi:hypothetical protein